MRSGGGYPSVEMQLVYSIALALAPAIWSTMEVGSSHGIVAKVLHLKIIVSLNPIRAIKFTYGLVSFGKV